MLPPPPLSNYLGAWPPLSSPSSTPVMTFEHCRYLLSSMSVLNAYKHENTNINQHFAGSYKPRMLFFLLINVKMPTVVGLLTSMSRKISCSADLSMIFITSGPDISKYHVISKNVVQTHFLVLFSFQLFLSETTDITK